MARIHFNGNDANGRDGDTEADAGNVEAGTISKPVKRQRWATQRLKGQSGARKRLSILNRAAPGLKFSPYTEKGGKSNRNSRNLTEDSPMGQETAEEESKSRNIYMNIPVPPEERDEDGHPKQQYVRNKIRTAKYTPLSFIPKNLWFQFHNIANIYFLFVIVLNYFSIFGGSNPSLGSVPLIVIVIITGAKDAVEDYRRTVLDNELNNSPVYRLADWTNVNTSEDHVSLWRRSKKRTTRIMKAIWRALKGVRSRKSPAGKEPVEGDSKEQRLSTTTRPTIRTSLYSDRTSFHSTRETAGDDIPMTPVPSPGLPPGSQTDGHLAPYPRPDTAFSYEGSANGENPFVAPESGNGDANLQVKRSSKRKSALGAEKKYGSILDESRPIKEQARFKKDYWKDLRVGDFVRIYNDEQIPADLVVLSTSDPDGACYIETKNLDGETNLKVRQALQAGRTVRHARDCERAGFSIQSEGPHPNLYQYSGIMRWHQKDPHNAEVAEEEMAEPININNLLLRGCSLKNTEWVLGVVLFTGLETKIMLNSGVTPSKRANLAKDLNWYVIYNFIILFFMCLIAGTVQGVTWSRGHNSGAYFEFGSIGGSPALDGFITFWSAVILFQNLVPISLYISLEIIRSCQVFFIYNDTFMYYEKLDYPCTPKSWNISDDLGQIEYIFSDKTGTLTQNVMEFRKCTINGKPYGEAYTEAEAGLHRRQGVDVEEESGRILAQIAEHRVTMLHELRQMHDNPYLRDDDLTFVAPDFVADIKGQHGEEQKRAIEHFMLALALCHTVITETTPGDPPKVEFKAQSPDEAALVATARDCGFTVLGRTNDDIHLNILGQDRTYRVLNTLEFNSSRKRMSAIIRMPDGKIKLICKGADSMIYSRLVKGEQQGLRKTTAAHLELFAREGLRTLCIAERDLDEKTYQEWSRDHDLAAQALHDRDDKLEEVADRIERDLMLLGGTAIEDRLQDGVPDTIALLAEAGIKLWVLTGDKVETAINIGFSCNLLSNEMDLILIDLQESDREAAGRLLDQHLGTFQLTGSEEELAAARLNHGAPAPTHALVIDGESLKVVLEDELRQRFLLLCKQCKSVLCCRVSPAQKAAVVQLVKTGLDVMALAIGDGANDVAMIQEADVGVGIAGEEGRQAVMSSDYAIGQFRFLQRLMLVHGRWSYRRLGECIANFFYKNMVWTFALFWYQIYNNFDISYLFDYTYILLVNLVFTSLPVILMGILDQDVSDKVSLAVPQLYRRGIERKEWSPWKFWFYMADGVYQSAICFFMGYLLFAPATFESSSGHGVADRPRFGVYVACAAIFVVNTYILLNTFRWDWLMVLITSISILLIFFWTGVYTSFTSSFQFYKAASEVYGALTFWCLLLLIVTLCLLPRFCLKFFNANYRPQDIDIIREQVRQGAFKYLDQYEAYVPPNATLAAKQVSASASDSPASTLGQPAAVDSRHDRDASVTESARPIYPPSEAATATTHNPRSQNGSDETNQTRPSTEYARRTNRRPSLGQVRSSFDRTRQSFDKLRPSFEGSRNFSSAAMLTRMESSQSNPVSPARRRQDITADLG